MMKNFTLCLFILGTTFGNINAQDDRVASCYQEYAKLFEERGSKPIQDGTFDDVLITIRKGSSADCFYAKASVKNGHVELDKLFLKFIDGSYEKLEKAPKFDDPITIVNGISKTIVTKDEELVNVIFLTHLNPKKKAYKRAPMPNLN